MTLTRYGIAHNLETSPYILLVEYDINKEEMPRRRSVDELLEIMNSSDDKKMKQVCLGLLLTRFNEFKEKNENIRKQQNLNERTIKATVQNSMNILNNFNPNE